MIRNVRDATLNDSDKTTTVTAQKIWRIINIFVDITATATVGNRRMAVEWADGSDNVCGRITANTNVTAGQQKYFTFFSSHAAATTNVDDDFMVILPELILPAGFDIRVYDTGAVDAAADDMIVNFLVDEQGYH